MTRIYSLLIGINTFAQTASRITAFAVYGQDTTLPATDTGGYEYSNGNGGQICSSVANYKYNYPFVLMQPIDFESGYAGVVKSDSSWETGPSDTDISTQLFDTNNNIIYALSRIFSGGVWQNNYLSHYAYDRYNNLVQEIDTDWVYGRIWSITLDTNTYDSDNRLIQQINFIKLYLDSTIWIRGSKNIDIYNDSGYLTSVRFYTWDTASDSFIVYAPIDSEAFHYAGTRPDSFFNVSSDRGYTGPIGVYYFSPANDTMIVNYYGDGGPADNFVRITNTYDSYHNMISTSQIVLDSDLSSLGEYKTSWSYNTYNQVTCQRTYSRDSSGNWIFDGLARFYYQSYTSAVPYVTTNSAGLTLFPVPARHRITLKLSWPAAQPCTIAIYDASGHRVMQWAISAAQQYEQTISLQGMPPGNYTLSAQSSSQMLVKQFVLIN